MKPVVKIYTVKFAQSQIETYSAFYELEEAEQLAKEFGNGAEVVAHILS